MPFCIIPGPVNIRAPVVFQHSFGASGDNNRKDVERKLMDICDTTVNGVTPETPKIFSALVQSMKSISSKDLDLIYKKIQSNDICPTNNKRVAYVEFVTFVSFRCFYGSVNCLDVIQNFCSNSFILCNFLYQQRYK